MMTKDNNYLGGNSLKGSEFANYQARGDMGYMTKYLEGPEGCVTVDTYAQLDNIGTMSSSNGMAKTTSKDISTAVAESKQLDKNSAKISIYSIDGKKIFDSKISSIDYITNSSMKNYLTRNLQSHQIGMYIVDLSDDITNISFKHINKH